MLFPPWRLQRYLLPYNKIGYRSSSGGQANLGGLRCIVVLRRSLKFVVSVKPFQV